MAPGTALNETGAVVAAGWASAGAFISRPPAAMPSIAPTANADTNVIVLLSHSSRAARQGKAHQRHLLIFAGVADRAVVVHPNSPPGVTQGGGCLMAGRAPHLRLVLAFIGAGH